MEVQPPILEVASEAGSSTTTVFLLRNPEPVSETYVFTIQGFLPAGEDGQQTFLPLTETAGLPSWLYVSQSRITLKPGETVPVVVTFRPPADAKAGAYQAVVFANQAESSSVGGVTLGSRVGVLVFATVKGEVRRALSVGYFSRQGSRIVSHLPVSFDVLLRNEGDAHEVPEGRVRIQNAFGRVVTWLPLSMKGRVMRILPRSERRMMVQWGESRPSSSGVWSGLRAEWSPFAFGPYRAKVVLDGPFSTNASEDVLFFVLPWRTLVLAGGIFVLLWFVRRRR